MSAGGCVAVDGQLSTLTLLSPSMPVSLWGREPALDGNSFYNTLSHFILFLVVTAHLKR
jgi:hypothetical protein